MGHITNPVGFRVGRLSNWSSFWASDKYTYANQWILDYSFQRYFEYLFKKVGLLSYKKGFIFSHVDVFFYSNVYYVYIFIYNANIMLLNKGRFFYFWLRLSKLNDFFIGRLQRSYLKVNLSFCNFGLKVYKRTYLQDYKFKQQFLTLKNYLLVKSSFSLQRLAHFLYWYKLGFFHKNLVEQFKLKNLYVSKRYFLFKDYAKSNKKKELFVKCRLSFNNILKKMDFIRNQGESE